MTKKEIQQIINQDWDSRRKKQKERSKLNSERTKKWTARELEHRNLKRWKHYIQEQLIKGPGKDATT